VSLVKRAVRIQIEMPRCRLRAARAQKFPWREGDRKRSAAVRRDAAAPVATSCLGIAFSPGNFLRARRAQTTSPAISILSGRRV